MFSKLWELSWINLLLFLAAHCVTNDYGDVLPKEDYIVGAGKLYNEYMARKDQFAQYLQVNVTII